MSEEMRYKDEFKFFAEDFWKLYDQQNGKCALTNRKLTPDNTEVELRNPHVTMENGRAKFDNHYMIDRSIRYLARQLSESEIIELAVEVVKHRGKDHGYEIQKIKKSNK